MPTKEPYRLDHLKDRARKAFERANPAFWKRVQGNPELATQAKTIHDRARSISLRLETHIHKHRQKWIAREAVKVFEERGRPGFEHPRPSWAMDQPVNVSYLEEARRRVQSRIQSRKARINAAAERMIEAQEVRNRVPDLQSKIHKIVKRTQDIRIRCNRHFNLKRSLWVVQARERGEENSEAAVYRRHRQRQDRINSAEHNLIRQTFQEYGRILPKQQEKTLNQNFEQVL